MGINVKAMASAIGKNLSELGAGTMQHGVGEVASGLSRDFVNDFKGAGESGFFGGNSIYSHAQRGVKSVLGEGGLGLSDRFSGNLAHGLVGGAIGATAIGTTSAAQNDFGTGGGVGAGLVNAAAIAAATANPMAMGRGWAAGAAHVMNEDTAIGKAVASAKNMASKMQSTNSVNAESVVSNTASTADSRYDTLSASFDEAFDDFNSNNGKQSRAVNTGRRQKKESRR